ncbi:MAG TPA: glycosyltransferase family 4 protein [Bacteroidales bacterium]|nr:glycosyltransferase family 4 protein [Bacteroidales bacterium]
MIIHLHFHRRATGVTRSVENILPFLNRYVEARVFGYGIRAAKTGFPALLKAMRSGKIQVIHAHRNNELIFALLLRMIGGIFHLVFTRHSDTIPSKFTLFLMKRADRLITLNPGMSETLPLKNTIVRHGVNTEFFNIGEKKRLTGIPQKNLISVIGRIRPEKGQITVIKASVPLLRENPDWGLLLIGKCDRSEYLSKILSIASENGISAQVHIIPQNNNILSFYQASSVIVIASLSEGFSLVCLEAMACGLVTIATAGVGIHSEVISHGENGFLFPADDADSLSEILSMVRGDKINLDPEAIRQVVTDKWSTNKSASELLMVYKIDLDR